MPRQSAVFDDYQTAESIKAFDKNTEPEKRQVERLHRSPKRNADALATWERALQIEKSADIYEFGNETREVVYFDIAQ